MPATTAYLDTLNSEQRRAVEHGLSQQDCTVAGPLLVIAGAGSGKTNTLAHRVAHLIVNGADPRRILLMTFSRRAAAEMVKRVERISRKAMGDKAGVLTDALTWAGTFHGIGARLLREYAEQIGRVLDYDDLLLYWWQMMSDSALADEVGGRFDHVLVDEYQDTNRLQSSILLGLKPRGQGLTVVGDDAQAIYSFRAATVRNILDFPNQFSPAANIITLDRNYRSTQNILAAANGVIGLAAENTIRAGINCRF
jgi:superfamily I DNA/RNA helicase